MRISRKHEGGRRYNFTHQPINKRFQIFSQDSPAVATLILHITFDIIVKSTFATFSSEVKKRSRSIDLYSIGEIVPVSHRFVESDIMGQFDEV